MAAADQPELFPAEPAAAEPAAAEPFHVELVRSTRRTRTVGAQLVGGVLRITVPSWMSATEQRLWVDKMTARFRRTMTADRIDLTARAATLARRHDLPRPTTIRWADDMTARWGSCSPHSGSVRLSTRLAAFPDWVIEYVIVHELAHLEQPGHGPEFWRLVHRYPKAERAIGYLIAKSGAPDDTSDDDDTRGDGTLHDRTD